MNDSTFNPEQFLGTTTEETGPTAYTPVPIGEWLGTCTKIVARSGVSPKTNETWHMLNVTWEFKDPKVLEVTKGEAAFANQSFFLDLKEGGILDFGVNKNVQLSRLRDAVGQQRTGRPWAPAHLVGTTAICMVAHENDDNGDPRAVVKRVANVNASRGQAQTPGARSPGAPAKRA